MIGGDWSDLGVVEMWENSGNMVYQNAENLRPQIALDGMAFTLVSFFCVPDDLVIIFVVDRCGLCEDMTLPVVVGVSDTSQTFKGASRSPLRGPIGCGTRRDVNADARSFHA